MLECRELTERSCLLKESHSTVAKNFIYCDLLFKLKYQAGSGFHLTGNPYGKRLKRNT